MLSNKVKVNILIHSFALAHSLIVILLKFIGVADDIALTMLTIGMIIWITRIFNFPIDISAALALLSCFAGFYLGTKGAELGTMYLGSLKEYSNIITTFIVTEILGWITFLIVSKK